MSFCMSLRRRFTQQTWLPNPHSASCSSPAYAGQSVPLWLTGLSLVLFLPFLLYGFSFLTLALRFFCLDIPDRSIAASGPPILRRGLSPPIQPMMVAPRHMQTPCSPSLSLLSSTLAVSYFSLRNENSACRWSSSLLPCLCLANGSVHHPPTSPTTTPPMPTPSTSIALSLDISHPAAIYHEQVRG